MIGQGATHTQSSPSPPPPSLPSLTGEANVDMLACSPFDSVASPPPSSAGDPRRPPPRAPHPSEVLKCPRCESLDTKFCYYNNYSLTQPRYFCKNCKRYWTAGGALRNVPVGGGLRKNKRSKLKLAAADAEAAFAAQALAAGGAQAQAQAHQQQTDEMIGMEAAGEVSQTVDNRAAVFTNVGQPPHNTVGIRAVDMYPHHPGRGSSMVQYGEPIEQNGGGATANQPDPRYFGNDEQSAGLDFFGEPGHVTQFYSSYSANLPVPYVNTVAAAAGTGYTVNYSFLPPSDTVKAEASSKEGHSRSTGGEGNESKHGEAGNNYDWQLVSEGLFNNGGGTSDAGNFYYMPSSSWPDFPQFNDTGAE